MLLVALLLVIVARQRLAQPATHRAIGRVLAVETATTLPISAEAPSTAESINKLAPAIDLSLIETIEDNRFFRETEQAAWFALIEKLQTNGTEELSLSASRVGYAALSSQPQVYRARLVTVAGTVRLVEEVAPAENDLGIDRLYRAVLQPEGGGVWPIMVYTIEPPAQIDSERFTPYETSALGYFFKKLSYRWQEGVGIAPVIIAERLQVAEPGDPILTKAPPSPAPVEPAPIEPTSIENEPIGFETPPEGSLGKTLLTDLGVDLTQLDAVRDRRRLTREDTAPFYAMLDAVEATPASQLVRIARMGIGRFAESTQRSTGPSLKDRQVLAAVQKEAARSNYSVAPLFGDGARLRGELFVFDAIVRRAIRIEPSDDANGETDPYYELEAFPEDSQNLPLVFCMRDLPPGFPTGEAIRQPARLAGFFFKQWAYRTRRPTGTALREDRRQFAPLLIGRAPIALAVEGPSERPGLAVGVLTTLFLAAVAITAWRLGRQDKRYQADTLKPLREPAEQDFSRLE